jgi:hypothetical protein
VHGQAVFTYVAVWLGLRENSRNVLINRSDKTPLSGPWKLNEMTDVCVLSIRLWDLILLPCCAIALSVNLEITCQTWKSDCQDKSDSNPTLAASVLVSGCEWASLRPVHPNQRVNHTRVFAVPDLSPSFQNNDEINSTAKARS